MNYSIRTKTSWAKTQSDIAECFRKWGIREWGTNYPHGARSEKWYQEENDRTVTLEWVEKDGKKIKLAMSKQARAVDNLRVLYLAVEAMRLNEARGIGEVLASAYKQLGNGNQSVEEQLIERSKHNPWDILEVNENASLEVAEASYKAKVLHTHPDKGGSEDEMKILNNAIKYFREERK